MLPNQESECNFYFSSERKKEIEASTENSNEQRFQFVSARDKGSSEVFQAQAPPYSLLPHFLVSQEKATDISKILNPESLNLRRPV